MTPTPFNNTGYLPSFHIGKPMLAANPSSSSLYIAEINTLPVLMQGKIPSCVSHGVAWAKMQYDLVHTGSFKTLSPRFLHALSKQPGQVPGDGRSIDKVLEVAMQYGIPEEQYFPDDTSLSFEEYEDASLIPQAAYDNALLHKVGSYGYVSDTSIQGILSCLEANKGVGILGMEISARWWTDAAGNVTWDATKILPLYPAYDGNAHCVVIYSANTADNVIGIQNSWSDQWANKGTGFFKPADLQFIYECAVITS